jgi:hypothetical protein
VCSCNMICTLICTCGGGYIQIHSNMICTLICTRGSSRSIYC